MWMHGVKSFKVTIAAPVEPPTPSDHPAGTPADPAVPGDSFDVTGALSGGSGSPHSSNPLDSFMVGDGTVDDTFQASMANFPPTLEEAQISFAGQPIPYDTLRNKYLETAQKLAVVKQQQQALITGGGLAASEIRTIQEKIDAIDAAIARCNAQAEKCQSAGADQQSLFAREHSVWKDLNNDKIVGDPADLDHSYGTQTLADGTVLFFDRKTGEAIPFPTLVPPDYQPHVWSGAVEEITTPPPPTEFSGTDTPDITLRITADEKLMIDPAVQMNIPPVLYVRKDPHSNNPLHNEHGQMIVYNQFENGVQKIPQDDLSNWMPVSIGNVKVSSTPALDEHGHALVAADGTALYDDVYTFSTYDGDGMPAAVLTVRVTGYFDNTGQSPAAATLADGRKYVAASTLTPQLSGAELPGPIEMDASTRQSTGRYYDSNFASLLPAGAGPAQPDAQQLQLEGAATPDDTSDDVYGLSQNEINTQAWNEALGIHAGRDVTTDSYTREKVDESGHPVTSGPGGVWRYSSTPDHWIVFDGSVSGSSHNAYISNQQDLDVQRQDNSSIQTLRTGVIFDQVRGKITGSAASDIARIPPADWVPDLYKNILPEKMRHISPTDAAYTTMYDGKGGHDAVIAGRGNLYSFGATFVYKVSAADDHVVLKTVAGRRTLADGEPTPLHEPKHYFHVEGGHVMIHNEDNRDTDAQDGSDNRARRINAFDISGSADVKFAAPTDVNVPTGASSDGFTDTAYQQQLTDDQTALHTAISRPPKPDNSPQAMQQRAHDAMGPTEASMNDEMNQFFSEWDGIFNEFAGVKTEAQAP